MQDIFNFEYTLTLLEAVEKIDAPATFLADTFFPQGHKAGTAFVTGEYRNEKRKLAP